MSHGKEDVLLEERIEKIRRKNEEIKRRHLEVEADKQSAAKQNALVQPRAHTEDWTSDWCAPVGTVGRRKQSERDAWPASPRPQHTQPRAARRRPETNATPKPSGRCFVFTEGDSPPPDPVYNFLADSARDTAGEERRGRRAGLRLAGGRGASGRQRGRDRLQNHKEIRPTKEHAEYEAWRAERNRIDQDRINRQKTAEGLWRREWDNEKVTEDFEDDEVVRGPVGRPPQARFGSGRLGTASVEISASHTGNAQSDAPSKNFSHSRGQRTQPHSSPDNCDLPPRTPPQSKRNICKVDGTLTISISNTACPSTTGPLQRVRVKPPTVVGSGRVGPHQKNRMSYSSQSDEEQLPPRQRMSNGGHTPSSPARNAGQTVKFNRASLRPPLPPATTPDGQVASGQHGEFLGNRRSRKRNMRGDYSKREEHRAGSTGSSRGESEGAGDESWEDVTTSGAESACETAEDKTRPHDGNQARPRHDAESASSGSESGKGRKISLEQARNKEADEKSKKVETTHTDTLPVSHSSSSDQAIHQSVKDLDDYCIPSTNHRDIGDLESDPLGESVRGNNEVNFKEGMKSGPVEIFECFEEGLQEVA